MSSYSLLKRENSLTATVAGQPRILLAGEPTGNLDTKNGEAVMLLLRELNEEDATICMVTHDVRYEVEAGRVVQLVDGQTLSS